QPRDSFPTRRSSDLHGQSYISNEYTVRTHGVAQWLNQHGMDTLCFVRPGRPWELGIELESESIQSVVKGVRYIHSFWPRGEVPRSEEHTSELQSREN